MGSGIESDNSEHWDHLIPLQEIENRLRALVRPELEGLIGDIENARKSIADL